MRKLVQALPKSLRAKIIIRSFVPTAIILMGVGLVSFFTFQRVTEEFALQRDLETTLGSASRLATVLEKYENILADIARTPDIYRDEPPAQRAALKQTNSDLGVFDGGILLLDAFGTVIAAKPEQSKILGQDWSTRAYYREIVRSQRAAFSPDLVLSNIVPDGLDGADVIVCALPVVGDQDEFRGVLLGMFRVGPTAVNAFYGDIIRLHIGESGNGFLVDGSGRVIYHPEGEHTGQDLNALIAVQQVLNGQADAIRTRDLAGQNIVAGFAPVPGTSWGLVTEETWATLTGRFRGYQNFLIILLLLGVIAPAIGVSVGIKGITKSITELMNAAQEVAQGNFGQTIVVQTGDEIEELARQFNLMSAQLETSYTNLEQRVAKLKALEEATAALTATLDLDQVLNHILAQVSRVVPNDATTIMLIEGDLARVVRWRGYERLGLEELISRSTIRTSESPNLQIMVDSREAVFIADTADYPGWIQVPSYEWVHSYAGAPIIVRDEVIGFLNVNSAIPGFFTQAHAQALRAFAVHAAAAIENARLYKAAQQELAERMRAEEELKKYRDHLKELVKERTAELEQANAELSQYAYVVSHDIRAPLRAIHNYADFIREDLGATLDDEQKAYLDGLGRAVQETEELVEDLLELSRIGRQAIPIETIDVGAFLQELVASLDLAPKAEIVMARDWPTLDVERVLLRQVFQNLVDNAVKFNDSPSRRVELGWRAIGEDAYEVFVRDNGLGIDPRYHEQIFRVFERLYTRQEYEGTGIGLAIVKKAAGKLGGSVRVESKPGQGSTFFVTLPKTQVKALE